MEWGVVLFMLSAIMQGFFFWQYYECWKHKKTSWIYLMTIVLTFTVLGNVLALRLQESMNIAGTLFTASIVLFAIALDYALAKKNRSLVMETLITADLTYGYIVIVDMLAIGLAYLGFLIWNKYTSAIVTQLNALASSAVSEEAAVQVANSLQQQITLLVAWSALYLLALIIIFNISQYFAWKFVSKDKFSAKYMFKFFLLNMLWFLIWLLPMAFVGLVLWISRDAIAAASYPGLLYLYIPLLVFLIMYLYLTFLAHADFARTTSLKALGRAFMFGFARIKHFLLPLFNAIAFFILLNTLFFIPLVMFNKLYVLMCYLVVMLVYFCFARYLFYGAVVHAAEKDKK